VRPIDVQCSQWLCTLQQPADHLVHMKGTGFSPYINLPTGFWASAPENLFKN